MGEGPTNMSGALSIGKQSIIGAKALVTQRLLGPAID
jgi:carbonic anhydrase/acetyltransferase-like protein (isoleucine patch superfamily)